MPELSVIIPTLDEAGGLGGLLEQLAAEDAIDLEVVVADGGSVDQTVAIAESGGARVVSSAAGRGRQLNRGREAARAPLLLFLHADSRLTENGQVARAVAAFRAASEEPELAGHFQLRFQGTREPMFTYYEGLSALGRAQTVNGDQGLLIRASWLDALGGFDARLPFLEDQALGVRIFEAGAWVLLPGRLETSARRFAVEGLVERSIHNAFTMAFFSFDYQPFLTATPSRYPVQEQSRRLRMTPLFREVWSLIRREPRLLLPLARYVNRHALWRAAFWLDVRRHGDAAVRRHPRLDVHDRWIAPWMYGRLGDALCILPMLVAFGVLWWRASRREHALAV